MKILLIVDPQRDFCLGGALAVGGSEEVIATTNELLMSQMFAHKFASKDWHPADHMSFSSWPVHCVQGSAGAEFHPALHAELIDRVILKGCDQELDSYSAFFDNAANKPTDLPALLESIEQQSGERIELYVCGLALDYCVLWSALDARKLGYDTTLVFDATRAVNLEPDDGLDALSRMRAAGVKMIDSRTLIRSIRVESGQQENQVDVSLPAVEKRARMPEIEIGR